MERRLDGLKKSALAVSRDEKLEQGGCLVSGDRY